MTKGDGSMEDFCAGSQEFWTPLTKADIYQILLSAGRFENTRQIMLSRNRCLMTIFPAFWKHLPDGSFQK